MKPNEHQFSSLDTTYEPDGSCLKPISFEKNEKLDLDALIEKKERSILYGFPPSNDIGNEQDNSLINNAKSRKKIVLPMKKI